MWESSNGYFMDLDLDDLNIDQAYINITSHLPNTIWMYTLSEDCIKCPFTRYREIAGERHITPRINVARPWIWKFYEEDHGLLTDNDTELCTMTPTLGQFGVYNVDIYKDACDIEITKEPVSVNWSLLYVAIIVLIASLCVRLVYTLYNKYIIKDNGQPKDDGELVKPIVQKPRLRSLDTFRGITIMLMIFVNSGGGHYWWMEHAIWNGLHIADLVFPWFLWIMGVCIPMSVRSQLNRNVSKSKMLLTVLKRSIKLFVIGFCLGTMGGPDFANMRILGVLQRFGISYFVIASLFILCSKSIVVMLYPQSKFKRSIYDIILLVPQWLIILAITIIHVLITFTLPVPDCPTGYLGPGGRHDMNMFTNCTGGATGYIDKLILGEKHLYQWPTIRSVYNAYPFDPEGFFGCLLTLLQVFLGVQCGMILQVYSDAKSRIKRWCIWSIVLGIIGGILCGCSKENGWIPINKNLWSLSYVCITSCFAFLLLTICYIIVDIKNYWNGTPMIYAGMNSILLYVGHEIFHQAFPWHWHLDIWNTHFLRLIEAIWNTSLWVFIAFYLYCKNIFISL